MILDEKLKTGWVFLYRHLLYSTVFNNAKLLKVYIWCLLSASHKYIEKKVGNQNVHLTHGQFVTTRREACEELNMTESTTWQYLKQLEEYRIININSNNRFSIITVVSWGVYQSSEEKINNNTNNSEQIVIGIQELEKYPESIFGQIPTQNINDKGFIKLYRSLKNDAIFNNEKLLKVYIWCLFKATHKDHDQFVGKQPVKLLPGEFVTGRNKAGAELCMPPSTLWGYLKLLEESENIFIKSNNKFSVVTIKNWEIYQSQNGGNDNKSTSYEHKQEDKDKKINKIFNEQDKEYLLSKFLSTKISERSSLPLKDEKTLQKWSFVFEEMVSKDKQNIDEILQVLNYSQQNEYWQRFILSAYIFRKHYDKLYSQYKYKNKGA